MSWLSFQPLRILDNMLRIILWLLSLITLLFSHLDSPPATSEKPNMKNQANRIPEKPQRKRWSKVKIFGVQSQAGMTDLWIKNGIAIQDAVRLLTKRHLLYLSPRINYWFIDNSTGKRLHPSETIPGGAVLTLNIQYRNIDIQDPDSWSTHLRSIIAGFMFYTLPSLFATRFAFSRHLFGTLAFHLFAFPLGILFYLVFDRPASFVSSMFPLIASESLTRQFFIHGATSHGHSVFLKLPSSTTVENVMHLLLNKDIISYAGANQYSLSKGNSPPLDPDSTLSDLGIENGSHLCLHYAGVLGGASSRPLRSSRVPNTPRRTSKRSHEAVEWDDDEHSIYQVTPGKPSPKPSRVAKKRKAKENRTSAPHETRVVNTDPDFDEPGCSKWVNGPAAEVTTPRKRKRTFLDVDGSASCEEFELTTESSDEDEESNFSPSPERPIIGNKKARMSKGKGKASLGIPSSDRNQVADLPVTKRTKSVVPTTTQSSTGAKKSATSSLRDGRIVKVFKRDDKWPCYCDLIVCQQPYDTFKGWQQHMTRLRKAMWDGKSWKGPVCDTDTILTCQDNYASANLAAANSGYASASIAAANSYRTSGLRLTRKGLYECVDGRKCEHSGHDDWDTINWEDLDTEAHLDESCLILKELHMAIYKPFRLVFCIEHDSFHSLETLRLHLEQKHNASVPNSSSTHGIGKYDMFLKHITAAFPIPESKTAEDYPPEISRPVPHLKIKLFFICPICTHATGSENASMIRQQLRQHFKNSKACAAAPKVKELMKSYEELVKGDLQKDQIFEFEEVRYGQVVATSSKMHPKQWVLYLPRDWRPPVSDSEPAVQVEAAKTSSSKKGNVGGACGQSYAQKLGWIDHFGDKISNWKQLSSYGTKKDVGEDVGEPERKQREAVQRGLSVIKEFLFDYLQGAVSFVGSLNDGFRRELTTEAKTTSDKPGKSMYRNLVPSSLQKYKEALYGPIALALWLAHAEEIEDVPKGVSGDDLMDEPAQDAVGDLYYFFQELNPDEDVPEEALGRHIHKLLFTFLTTQASVAKKVAGPFEYALVLSSYIGPDEGFAPPTVPSRTCAMQQFCLRSTVVHLSRLGDHFSDYKPYKVPSQPCTEEVEEEESPSDNRPDSPDPNADPMVALENVEDDTPSPPQFEASWKGGESSKKSTSKFKKRLEMLKNKPTVEKEVSKLPERKKDPYLTNLSIFRKWIANGRETGSMLTAFQRTKQAWLDLYPLAMEVLGSTHVSPTLTGLSYLYNSPRVDAEIHLNAVRSLVYSLLKSVRKGLDDLLPSTLSEKPTIDVRTLKDNLALVESVMVQNSGAFKPWEDRLYDLLEGQSKNATEKWQGKAETVLEDILGATALTSGLLARGFQMSDFRYGSSRLAKRNVFLFRGSVVIAFPKSKSYAKRVQNTLWALPPDLGEHLLLYLGVIRPVSMRLTIQWKRSPNQFADTHVFVSPPGKTGGNARQAWDGSRIDSVLRSQSKPTLGLGFSSGMLRQLITAIFSEHLPHLIDNPTKMKKTTSAANGQGDHNQNTADKSYGKTGGSGVDSKLSDGDMKHFVTVSESWQALLGVIPPGQEMLRLFLKTPHVAPLNFNRDIAMNVARKAICKEYGIGGGNSVKKAASLLEDKPFLLRVEDESLGDSVLIQTVSALLYGTGRPSGDDSAPVLGVSMDIVTEAIMLITLGLWEVKQGTEYVLSRSIDVRDELTTLILPDMIHVREEDKETTNGTKWQTLGIKAYQHAKAELTGQIGGSELTAYFKKNAAT